MTANRRYRSPGHDITWDFSSGLQVQRRYDDTARRFGSEFNRPPRSTAQRISFAALHGISIDPIFLKTLLNKFRWSKMKDVPVKLVRVEENDYYYFKVCDMVAKLNLKNITQEMQWFYEEQSIGYHLEVSAVELKDEQIIAVKDNGIYKRCCYVELDPDHDLYPSAYDLDNDEFFSLMGRYIYIMGEQFTRTPFMVIKCKVENAGEQLLGPEFPMQLWNLFWGLDISEAQKKVFTALPKGLENVDILKLKSMRTSPEITFEDSLLAVLDIPMRPAVINAIADLLLEAVTLPVSSQSVYGSDFMQLYSPESRQVPVVSGSIDNSQQAPVVSGSVGNTS